MQSIYRFRQAEVGLFLQLQRAADLRNVPLEPLTLTANFRSQAGIVEWVNACSRQCWRRRDNAGAGAVRYSPASRRVSSARGGVQVHPSFDK